MSRRWVWLWWAVLMWVVPATLAVLWCRLASAADGPGCTQTWVWTGNNNQTFGDSNGACASYNATQGPDAFGTINKYTFHPGAGPFLNGGPNSEYQYCDQTLEHTDPTDNPPTKTIETPNAMVVNATAGPCVTDPCSAKSGQTKQFTTASGDCSGISRDQDGCQLKNVVSVKAGGVCAVSGVETGSQAPPTAQPTQSGGCISSAGGTVCTEAGNNKQNCGTVNGDEVCPKSIPPGTCQSFPSGGVACTETPNQGGGSSAQSPPAPDNGTPGQPAVPTASIQRVDPADGTTVISNYYSSTTVAGSGTGVATTPGGVNVGNGGTGGGSGSGNGGSGNGAGTNPDNGDCGADGVDCGGDGTVPQFEPVKTLQGTASDYYNALASVPIVAAVAGIGASLPSGGDCPTSTFSVFGQSFTLDVQCQLWATYVGPIMAIVMLVFWTILGVRIAMSA